MSATNTAKDLIEDMFTKTVNLDSVVPHSAPGLKSAGSKVVKYLFKVAKMLVLWLMKPENWLRKRTWVAAFVLLRAAYVTMNEYGKNPFKKQLDKDHVYLTGAGSGIGRLMAVRLGKLGCKLSLSDVNMAGLEETKSICIQQGIPETSIAIFFCDVSKRESITKGA
jgi:hypothetical protein